MSLCKCDTASAAVVFASVLIGVVL